MVLRSFLLLMGRWRQRLDPLRSPRRLMVVFLAFVLAPAAALGWFAWKLAGQDIKDERLRIHERHRQAADLIVTTLDQKLTAAQQQLSDPAKAASEAASGARVVVLGVRE